MKSVLERCLSGSSVSTELKKQRLLGRSLQLKKLQRNISVLGLPLTFSSVCRTLESIPRVGPQSVMDASVWIARRSSRHQENSEEICWKLQAETQLACFCQRTHESVTEFVSLRQKFEQFIRQPHALNLGSSVSFQILLQVSQRRIKLTLQLTRDNDVGQFSVFPGTASVQRFNVFFASAVLRSHFPIPHFVE